MKKSTRSAAGPLVAIAMLLGCGLLASCGEKPVPYGEERQLFLPGTHRLVWAIAPTLNISGQNHVDPLLQSDLVYQQVQQVHGLTVIPVDRVVEVYAALRLEKVQTQAQAAAVCEALGCDGLLIPTIMQYDPYDPPKIGASLQLYPRPGTLERAERIDPHTLDRSPTVGAPPPIEGAEELIQAVGIYDAANGTVRDRVNAFAAGRVDPTGPLGTREMYLDADRFGAFVFHELLTQLLDQLAAPKP